MGSPVGEGGKNAREREREKERVRERENGVGGVGAVKKGRIPKGKEEERDRERERMDVVLPMSGMPPGMEPGIGMGKRWEDVEQGEDEQGAADVDDSMEAYWEEEEDVEEVPEVRARVCINLGTYVYPKLPFPYFFDTGNVDVKSVSGCEQQPAREKEQEEKDGEKGEGEDAMEVDKEKEAEEKEKGKTETKTITKEEEKYTVDFETRATIIIPNAHIPLDRPSKPRIWGGGILGRPKKMVMRKRPKRGVPADNETRSSGALPVKRRGRRIYTDDSDVFLCAVHSGWITWSGAVRAREQGQDMKVEVRVLRCAGAGVRW